MQLGLLLRRQQLLLLLQALPLPLLPPELQLLLKAAHLQL
jgi:hypothetical protein